MVLVQERVVEQDGHEELTTQGGAYARLCRLQASGYQEPAREAVPSEP